MNSFVFFVAALVSVHAGLISSPSTKILQGPSSRTTIIGPDGSSISAVSPGGRIITEEQPGIIAEAVPIISTAPLIAKTIAAPITGLSAETVVAGPSGTITATKPLVSAPILSVAEAGLLDNSYSLTTGLGGNSVVAGPSGVISAADSLISTF